MCFARRIRTRSRFIDTSVHCVGRASPVRQSPWGSIRTGRERLRFIPGDVAIPPYPMWVQADSALGSIARLMRQLHDASVGLDLGEVTWSDEMADPVDGEVMCHNDVCLENVVFRDGEAVALLDFDFAAPGRREFDLAAFARMCTDRRRHQRRQARLASAGPIRTAADRLRRVRARPRWPDGAA